jgi:hypothetical protein
MDNKFFLHQIKRTNGAIDKGIVVKDTFEGAKQSYHAYLGAYAYGQNADTDFVSCEITDIYGARLMNETWVKQEQPEPDTEPEVS